MRKKQFIMVMHKNSLNRILFNDLKNDKRVTVYNDLEKNLNGSLFRLMRCAHYSHKVNKIIRLPFKKVWGYVLDEIVYDENINYYIIMTNASLYQFDLSYLSKKRKLYSNIKFILYLEDPMTNIKRACGYEYSDIVNFDYVFTFDPIDAEKYGFIYTSLPYSIINNKFVELKRDLYLSATNKGRLDFFLKIYNLLDSGGVNALFRIVEVSSEKQQFKKKIIYNKRLTYNEILNEVKESNCILELLAKGQAAATMRYYEAVCYNKKLLTNNKDVVNLPFYNPEYIHIFEKPEDIDCEWIKERIPIDYGYDGRFSPTCLIDKIVELEEQKEG